MSDWKKLTQISENEAHEIIQTLQKNNIPYRKGKKEEQNAFTIEVTQNKFEEAKNLLSNLQRTKPELFMNAEGMPQINNIAVPVDFSEYSEQIGKIAMRIGEKYKAKVWLVHSFSPPVVDTMAPEGYSTRIDVLMDDLNEAAKNNMNDLFEKLQTFGDEHSFTHVMLDYMIFSTTPEDMIRQTKEKITPDLHIIGTRGGGEEQKTIIGSVAEKIISEADVPVLVVPLSSNFKGLESVNNLVYATNFDESDFAAIKKLIYLIKPFEPTIHCLHIAEGNAGKWDEMKMFGLKSYFKDAYNYDNVQVKIIEDKEVLSGLNNYIQEGDVGLVALTTHKRNLITKLFNPSITREFLIHTHIPLLVFHA